MRRYTLEIRGRQFIVDVNEISPNRFEVMVGGKTYDVALAGDEDLPNSAITPAVPPPPVRGALPTVSPALATPRTSPSSEPTRGIDTLTAPMPGVIATIGVKPGDPVTRGQEVVVLDAMKMMNSIKAPRDGVVVEICVTAGQAVGHGDPIVRFRER
jgi:biotin carboxyl carrier protein